MDELEAALQAIKSSREGLEASILIDIYIYIYIYILSVVCIISVIYSMSLITYNIYVIYFMRYIY